MSETEFPKEYVEHFTKRGFLLKRRIGFGASGTVIQAQQTNLERDVAVKLFDSPINKSNAILRKRFEREALLLSRVQHPSIPVVLTRNQVPMGDGSTVPYLVMEYINGRRLRDIIDHERRLPYTGAVGYLKQMLDALSCIHQQSIVHRDVRPENVLVLPSGHLYLIDLSIGVTLDKRPGFTRVTGDRQPGLLEYMPPEQETGTEIDHRADIFAAGVVLYEMLTGHPRVKLDALDVDLPQVPSGLKEAINKACQSDPGERFQTAEEFIRSLEPLISKVMPSPEPSSAICPSFRCPGTQWSEYGSYEGPRTVETTDSYCNLCGAELLHRCKQCDAELSGHPFCGSCGNRIYEIPTCTRCGSRLLRTEIGKTSYKTGCLQCRDDVPF